MINEYFIMMKRGILIAGMVAIVAACMVSCNVTRVVSTESQYWQKGETSCTIVTKTVESYDASKKTF